MSSTVGIGLPVYNGLPYLLSAIDSVRTQTYQNWKLHIVENQSKDGTLEKLEAHLRPLNDERIVIHRNEAHLPMAGNFNRAIEIIRDYEYFKLFCADDLLLAECLAEQVNDLAQHPKAAIAASARWILKADGRRLFARSHFRHSGELPGKEVIRQCLLAGTNVIGEPAAVLLRSEGLPEVFQMDGAHPYVVDLNLWSDALRERTIYFNAKPLACFRTHKAGATASLTGRILQDFLAFRKRAQADHAITLPGWRSALLGPKIRLNSLLRSFIYRYLSG